MSAFPPATLTTCDPLKAEGFVNNELIVERLTVAPVPAQLCTVEVEVLVVGNSKLEFVTVAETWASPVCPTKTIREKAAIAIKM